MSALLILLVILGIFLIVALHLVLARIVSEIDKMPILPSEQGRETESLLSKFRTCRLQVDNHIVEPNG